MVSYQYRNSHYKDKTVYQPPYLYDWNPNTWKDTLYIQTGTVLLPQQHQVIARANTDNEVLWHSPKTNFTENAEVTKTCLKIYAFKVENLNTSHGTLS